MATIDIRHKHSLSHQQAQKAVNAFIQEIGGDFGLQSKWENDKLLSFEATAGMVKGTQGSLTLEADVVKLSLDLPFRFRPLKAVIEAQVKSKLQDKLG